MNMPHILHEWDYAKNDCSPSEVTAFSKKKVWWVCKNKHSWAAAIKDRIRKGSDCPICSESKGEKLIQEFFERAGLSEICKGQYAIPDCKYINTLRHDFGIVTPDGVLLFTIEFNGEQHYRPVDFSGHGKKYAEQQFKTNKLRDKAKREYLKEHGIPQYVFTYKQSEEEILQALNDLVRKWDLERFCKQD